ncbi:restriction endonuclease subunit S [Clostridium perfringens]|nr:restriction endonuclease subunit S [Clostridium perfringens]
MGKKVREGYKKTDFGEIPIEWKVKKFRDIFERIVEKNKNNISDNVLTISAQNGLINQEKFFNKSVASKNTSNYFLLKKGDFAYNKSYSSGYPMGAIKRLNSYNKGIVSPLYICFRIKDENINSDFYEQFFEYDLFDKAISGIAQEGARNHGLLNVAVNEFFDLPIIVPTKEEQKKIAEILSTVDKQIENTEKLIQKNQELKKGLMQQLLTKGIGHTEFKKTEIGDIPKEWEVKRFKDISKVSQGLQIAIEERFKEFKQGRLPYITIQYINDKSNSDNEYFIENYNENVVCYESDILMTRTGNTGIVITNEYGVFHNNFFKVDFDRTKLNKDFLVYYLNTPFIQNLIIRYAGTTTIPDLKHSDFYKLPVLVPKIEEQKKIALILSSIDENIIEYKDKKEKLKILKRGLMQKLLSGEIRILNFNEN